MVKRFFIGFILLSNSSVLAIPACLRACLPCFARRSLNERDKPDAYIEKYVTIKLNPIFEDKIYEERSCLDRLLDWCATKRVKRKR